MNYQGEGGGGWPKLEKQILSGANRTVPAVRFALWWWRTPIARQLPCNWCVMVHMEYLVLGAHCCRERTVSLFLQCDGKTFDRVQHLHQQRCAFIVNHCPPTAHDS